MFSKDKVKFKYRIVVNDDAEYPYRIQRKGWLFWHQYSRNRNIESAKEDILRAARQEMMRPGKVVFEYTDEDFLVDKLKGHDV